MKKKTKEFKKQNKIFLVSLIILFVFFFFFTTQYFPYSGDGDDLWLTGLSYIIYAIIQSLYFASLITIISFILDSKEKKRLFFRSFLHIISLIVTPIIALVSLGLVLVTDLYYIIFIILAIIYFLLFSYIHISLLNLKKRKYNINFFDFLLSVFWFYWVGYVIALGGYGGHEGYGIFQKAGIFVFTILSFIFLFIMLKIKKRNSKK